MEFIPYVHFFWHFITYASTAFLHFSKFLIFKMLCSFVFTVIGLSCCINSWNIVTVFAQNRHNGINTVCIKFLELRIKTCQHLVMWPGTQCLRFLPYLWNWVIGTLLSKESFTQWNDIWKANRTTVLEEVILVFKKKSLTWHLQMGSMPSSTKWSHTAFYNFNLVLDLSLWNILEAKGRDWYHS